MSVNTNKLRLGPLPRTEMVKLTVSLPTDLKAVLDRYASLHSQVHGEDVDAAVLIPHMLAAFMDRDRGFWAMQSGKQASRVQTTLSNGMAGERL